MILILATIIVLELIAIIFLIYRQAILSSENHYLKKQLADFKIIEQQKNELDKENQVLKEKLSENSQLKQQWQQDKEEILFKISEELMKKNHLQQSEISSKQADAIEKITHQLFQNFQDVTLKVSSLNDDVKKNFEENNLLKNALLSPTATGRASEITLENILKFSGLKMKETLNSQGDYILQSHFANNFSDSINRPDAIIFLPNNQIIVVDAKSSAHFIELEKAKMQNDQENQKIILNKIKDSFKKHLESFKKKDYANSLLNYLNRIEQKDYQITSVMFLQSEKIMETLSEIDQNFIENALQKEIMVLSPVGLVNMLSQAKFIIDRIRQEKNIEELKKSVITLLDQVAVIFQESQEIGKSINKASSSYNKLANYLNKKINPSIKDIFELGIISKKAGEIKSLEIISQDHT
jgi:DNA recombination protein RmuC